jgi:uncharacterized protein
MSGTLPQSIHPYRLAHRGGSLIGQLPLVGMSRLRESLYSDAGEVHVNLRFRCDEQGRHRVDGSVRALLQLTCQRCLGAMGYEVDNEVHLELVARPEDAGRVENGYEPLLVRDDLVAVRSMVEDELLLALPAHPRHAEGQCRVAPEYRPQPQAESTERTRPFEVLAKLKH